MFFGYNVANTIYRLTHNDNYNILYRPHGSCYDHYIRHLVHKYVGQFFVSNDILIDDSINIIEGNNIEEVLNNRLCSQYSFQISSNVSKNIEATLYNHIPLIYTVHSKDDLIEIENNILGRYPYNILLSNKDLYNIALNMDIEKEKIFYAPFCVQDNLENKINQNEEKTVDVSLFIGSQNIDQVQDIVNKLKKYNISTRVLKNNFTSKALATIFSRTKMIVELNSYSIYNIIYAINCGVPAIIYNKESSELMDRSYIFGDLDEMVKKIKKLLHNDCEPLPKLGFPDSDAEDIKVILEKTNKLGLIV